MAPVQRVRQRPNDKYTRLSASHGLRSPAKGRHHLRGPGPRSHNALLWTLCRKRPCADGCRIRSASSARMVGPNIRKLCWAPSASAWRTTHRRIHDSRPSDISSRSDRGNALNSHIPWTRKSVRPDAIRARSKRRGSNHDRCLINETRLTPRSAALPRRRITPLASLSSTLPNSRRRPLPSKDRVTHDLEERKRIP